MFCVLSCDLHAVMLGPLATVTAPEMPMAELTLGVYPAPAFCHDPWRELACEFGAEADPWRWLDGNGEVEGARRWIGSDGR